MSLKKIPVIFTVVAGLSILTSCHEAYLNRLDLLETQVDQLKELCDQINENIAAMQYISISLQARDMITNYSTLKDESGNVTGYKIYFKNHAAITINNGIAGQIPIIGTKRKGTEGIFWYVQYGNGKEEWLKDENGNYIPKYGTTYPFLKIMNGKWYVSYDDGVTFQELGQADGENADTMFKSFNATEDYVEIVMSDGTVYKIPTEAAYKKYETEAEKVNQNLNTLQVLTKDIKDSVFIFITEMKEIKNDDGVKIANEIYLSNGEKFTIYDYQTSYIPYITIELDEQDMNYYWAIRYGETQQQWILDEEGKRIVAIEGYSSRPIIGTDIDTISTSVNKDSFVWTMQTGGDPYYMIDPVDSTTVLAVCQDSLFANVVDMGAYLQIEMKASGETYKICKKFSVSVDSTELTMAVSDTLTLNYSICGVCEENVDLYTQSGFKAYADTAANTITIISPAMFDSTDSQVMAIFTFMKDEISTTVTKTFNVIKKEEEE